MAPERNISNNNKFSAFRVLFLLPSYLFSPFTQPVQCGNVVLLFLLAFCIKQTNEHGGALLFRH